MDQKKFQSQILKYSEVCLGLFTNRSNKQRTLWIPFWTLSISNMLQAPEHLSNEIKAQLKETILSLYSKFQGGFSRYRKPLDYCHLAETYAAVASLSMLNETALLLSLEFKEGLLNLTKTLLKDSRFVSTDLYGEEDVRSFYFTAACFHMAYIGHFNTSDLKTKRYKKERDILKQFVDIISPSLDVLKKCLSFEGGFGSNINCEAHIGYTYAACNFVVLLEDICKLLEANFDTFKYFYLESEKIEMWLKDKQNADGGLCGRVNKPSDSCYSFWALGCQEFLRRGGKGTALFDNDKLESYIMSCYEEKSGTFKKKPNLEADFYHTYYSLCGLSLINPDKYGLKSVYAILGNCINN